MSQTRHCSMPHLGSLDTARVLNAAKMKLADKRSPVIGAVFIWTQTLIWRFKDNLQIRLLLWVCGVIETWNQFTFLPQNFCVALGKSLTLPVLIYNCWMLGCPLAQHFFFNENNERQKKDGSLEQVQKKGRWRREANGRDTGMCRL